jgi:hypothetical protein
VRARSQESGVRSQEEELEEEKRRIVLNPSDRFLLISTLIPCT